MVKEVRKTEGAKGAKAAKGAKKVKGTKAVKEVKAAKDVKAAWKVKEAGIRNIVLAACVLLCCGCSGEDGAVVIGGGDPEAEAWGNPEASVSLEGEALEGQGSQGQEVSIRVYVCGAVEAPGVVDIPEGSRVEDALLAAGGFSQEASREAVNLADWVTDGQMIYFPSQEEAEGNGQWLAEGGLQWQAEATSGLVNINTADVSLLCTLPGIGESRAADIVAYREKNGAFASCEDIMKVNGIKTSVYEKICDKITVR